MDRLSPKEVIGIVLQPLEMVSETLERKLGLFSVVILSLSAMLGSGLFVLPSLAMMELGDGNLPLGGIWLAYLFAGLVILPGAISKSELASAMPSSGGAYVYIEKTFGPIIGTISGLGLWANFMLKSAFALIGFRAYLWVLEGILDVSINLDYAVMIMLGLIVGINILGAKSIKKVQTPVVLVSVTYLMFVCIYALLTMELNWDAAISREALGADWHSFSSTAALVFVSYIGVTKVAAVGGEIKDPSKNMPYGILISLFFSIFLYVFVTLTMAITVDPLSYVENGHAREDPIYVFALIVGGKTIATIAATFAAFTVLSGSLAGIMAASRFLFAMARDNLLPDLFENVHSKYDTPHWAIIGTGLSMAAAILFLPVHDVAELASGFNLMVFILINACVLVLRNSAKSHWYKPEWKSPLYPFTQIFGILTGSVLIYAMGFKALFGGSAAVIIGIIIYQSYGKRHGQKSITPWETFRLQLTNPDEVEHRRRWAAFHAADINRNNHLNLHEFISAMESLGFSDGNQDTLREYFHAADHNEDGVLEIDEFLLGVEELEFD
ncbi:TPA: amino acid permease [Candidatus Thalassarchaeaceae archaeon]|nr:amino acid permease [Euryarchaeota archaeon]DAC66965.1 MAG TPA: amino acid permease [Candidatus Poseidoniales archaeon]HII42106.1 amino acid permease [Candidatus Thalassarchaeaceae archaeon]